MTARRYRPVSVERDAALYVLGLDPQNVRWDHRPALSVRVQVKHADGSITYTPDENDPRYIVPLAPDAHDKLTFGTSKATTAGSDIAVAAKIKRVEKDEAAFRQRLLAKDQGAPREPSRWPNRKMQSRPFEKKRHTP